MPAEDDDLDTTAVERRRAESAAARAEQRRRAEEALLSIKNGADPAAEAFALSNSFTDDLTGRIKALFSRRPRR